MNTYQRLTKKLMRKKKEDLVLMLLDSDYFREELEAFDRGDEE